MRTRLSVTLGTVLILAGTAGAQAPPGYLAVLHGNTPSIFLQNPANGSVVASWTLGGTLPRKVVVQHDETGRVTHMLIGRLGDAQYNVPAAITRLDVSTGVHTTLAEFPGLILSALAIEPDGSVLYAGRSASDGGCVYRLASDDAVDAFTNYGNGLLVLDPATGETTALNEVTGAGSPRLADVAVAPGGRIYIAASPVAAGLMSEGSDAESDGEAPSA